MIKSRKMFESHIYFIRFDGPILKVGGAEFPTAILDILIKENGIVIWENQGIFRLISAPILHNMWLTCEASQTLKKEYPRVRGAEGLKEISWNQGIIISPVIVRNILLVPFEGRNGFSDPETTTDSHGENQTIKP